MFRIELAFAGNRQRFMIWVIRGLIRWFENWYFHLWEKHCLVVVCLIRSILSLAISRTYQMQAYSLQANNCLDDKLHHHANPSEIWANDSQYSAGNNCRSETAIPIILMIHITTTTGHGHMAVLYTNPDLSESNCITIYTQYTFYICISSMELVNALSNALISDKINSMRLFSKETLTHEHIK